ncbi:MAG: DUF1566 domain-containing protein, partial [Polyangiaceae bacterium]|nr:DUF1566 domain-containing protein [Polyangiaceae bacterium]
MSAARFLAPIVLVFGCAHSVVSITPAAKVEAAPGTSYAVVGRYDAAALPTLASPLPRDVAGVAGVVLGLRRFEDPCGELVTVRLAPEVFFGSIDLHRLEPSAVDLVIARAAKDPPGRPPEVAPPCDGFSTRRSAGTETIRVGGRVVITLSHEVPVPPRWGSMQVSVAVSPLRNGPVAFAITELEALPSLLALYPPLHLEDTWEQYEPARRVPPPNTPHHRRRLGAGKRFDVKTDTIDDASMGLVWQRALSKPLDIDIGSYHCDASRVGGQDDWRMPTASEMLSILSPGVGWVDPAFATAEDAILWTRTDHDGALVAVAERGMLADTHYDIPSPYGPYQARCVRTQGQPVTAERDPIDLVDDELVDAMAGLTWARAAGGVMSLEDAEKACDRLVHGGHDDYRLPTTEDAFALALTCPTELDTWLEGTEEELWVAAKGDLRGAVMRRCSTDLDASIASSINGAPGTALAICVRLAPLAPLQPLACPSGSTAVRKGSIEQCEAQGRPAGPYRSYYPSGAVFEAGTHANGVRQGEVRVHHEHGGVWLTMRYDAGKLDGNVIATRPTGRVLARQRFAKGVPAGELTVHDEAGRVLERHAAASNGDGTFGQGTITSYDDEGSKRFEAAALGGFEHGEAHRFEGDRTSADETYRAGVLDGRSVFYRSHGGRETTTWVLGLEHGMSESFGPSGNLERRESMANGKFDGAVEIYDAKGNVLSKTTHRRGARIGRWTLRDAAGQIVEKGELDEEGTGTLTTFQDGKTYMVFPFVRGRRHGTFRTYDRDGTVSWEETYENDVLDGPTKRFHSGVLY